MKHWKYKAIDNAGEIVEGVIDSDDPYQAMLKLTNVGLNIIELVTASKDDQNIHKVTKRLMKLYAIKAAIDNKRHKPKRVKKISNDIDLIRRRAKLFKTKKTLMMATMLLIIVLVLLYCSSSIWM